MIESCRRWTSKRRDRRRHSAYLFIVVGCAYVRTCPVGERGVITKGSLWETVLRRKEEGRLLDQDLIHYFSPSYILFSPLSIYPFLPFILCCLIQSLLSSLLKTSNNTYATRPSRSYPYPDAPTAASPSAKSERSLFRRDPLVIWLL